MEQLSGLLECNKIDRKLINYSLFGWISAIDEWIPQEQSFNFRGLIVSTVSIIQN